MQIQKQFGIELFRLFPEKEVAGEVKQNKQTIFSDGVY